jgi:hypothetical protein
MNCEHDVWEGLDTEYAYESDCHSCRIAAKESEGFKENVSIAVEVLLRNLYSKNALEEVAIMDAVDDLSYYLGIKIPGSDLQIKRKHHENPMPDIYLDMTRIRR